MRKAFRTLPSLLTAPRGAALLTAMLAAGPALAQSHLGDDPALLARYRCGVLGEMTQCSFDATKPSPRLEERIVLGSRARFLIHNGVEPGMAVAQARREGEMPVREKVRITTRALSSAEAFDRANGRSVAPEQHVEVLSTRPVAVDGEAVASR